MTQYNARAEAQIINQVFAKHQAKFRIDPKLQWRETPAFVLFKLEMGLRQDINALGALRNNIEHALHACRYRQGLVGDTERTFVRINVQPLALEVNLPHPGALSYGDLKCPVDPHSALCGLHYGIKGDTPLIWQPSDSAQPHVLIAGTTGSGKTTLVQSLVLSMCAATSPVDLWFQFVDYKNSQALRWLAKLPHVRGMATEPDEAIEALRGFYNEILTRKRNGFDHAPRMVLVIDELASFTDNYEKGYRDEATRLLHEIARLGREYKMHLVACTQKPTAKVIGEQLKANLPVRLVGMVTSPEESKCATGIAQAGAHLLPGKGAFIYVNAGQVRRFQAPWVDDLAGEVRDIRAKWGSEIALHRSAPAAPPLHHPAPVQETERSYTSTQPSKPVAPVRTGARFPLADKRPLTPAEAAEVRAMAQSMSKNELCNQVYGSKSSRYMEWINAALSAKSEPAPSKPFSFRGVATNLKPI